MAHLKPTRRGLARQCLDWTERRHHLAGPLGVALLDVFCVKGWLRRSPRKRSVDITPAGLAALRQQLDLDVEALRMASKAATF
ncbi:MAG TPA: ArsR family transcriptional regulator [Stellaceae bacterium]|nr:ArsR family transcriptional regulator [Stellaceae bacterium]